MTTFVVQWVDTPAKTDLYWFPASASLADWTTYRVNPDERGAPDTGIYDATLDDAHGDLWFLFEGAAQPASWDAAISSKVLTDISAAIEAAATTPTLDPDEYRNNLLIRRRAISIELAALDSTKLGGKANVKHEDGGTTIDHIQYKKSLYDELKAIDDELLSDAITGDPFEESTFGELW